MKKNLTKFLLFFVLMIISVPITAYADIGPKPSVHITFEHMDHGQTCYGTLLSKAASTGPSSAWNGNSNYYRHSHGKDGYKIWKAFIEYDDSDGFYFLQEWWECSENQQLNWTYYPPQTFKILLYYPETNRFFVSGIYERYAFDSYYTVDMDTHGPDAQKTTLVAERSYDYTWELISLTCRIVITILLELAIALLFHFRQKKLFLLIVYINIITQVILNIALNIINYHRGLYAFMANYILFEMIVFLIEAVLYGLLFNKISQTRISKTKSTIYALCANACSFTAGIFITKIIPGIF